MCPTLYFAESAAYQTYGLKVGMGTKQESRFQTEY